MNNRNHPYHGYRFPPEIIGHSVWLYHRFCLSFRDVEDLLAERGSRSLAPAEQNSAYEWTNNLPTLVNLTEPA